MGAAIGINMGTKEMTPISNKEREALIKDIMKESMDYLGLKDCQLKVAYDFTTDSINVAMYNNYSTFNLPFTTESNIQAFADILVEPFFGGIKGSAYVKDKVKEAMESHTDKMTVAQSQIKELKAKLEYEQSLVKSLNEEIKRLIQHVDLTPGAVTGTAQAVFTPQPTANWQATAAQYGNANGFYWGLPDVAPEPTAAPAQGLLGRAANYLRGE